jgi:hypothetical protein
MLRVLTNLAGRGRPTSSGDEQSRIQTFQALIKAGKSYQAGCQAMSNQQWHIVRERLHAAVELLDSFFLANPPLAPYIKKRLDPSIPDAPGWQALDERIDTWWQNVTIELKQRAHDLNLPVPKQQLMDDLRAAVKGIYEAKQALAQTKANESYQIGKQEWEQLRGDHLRFLQIFSWIRIWSNLQQARSEFSDAPCAAPLDLHPLLSRAWRVTLAWSILTTALVIVSLVIVLYTWLFSQPLDSLLPSPSESYFRVTCVNNPSISVQREFIGDTIDLKVDSQIQIEATVEGVSSQELSAFWATHRGKILPDFQFINPTSYTAPTEGVPDEIVVAVLHPPTSQRWDGRLNIHVSASGGMCSPTD